MYKYYGTILQRAEKVRKCVLIAYSVLVKADLNLSALPECLISFIFTVNSL